MCHFDILVMVMVMVNNIYVVSWSVYQLEYNFYPLQTFAKVVFLHLSVSHSVHGGCLPQYMLGYTPLGPEADTAPMGADTPPAQCILYGQQAGGTHPTGMHTC